MHPRNRYNTPPDFTSLAKRYPPLRPYVFINEDNVAILDFQNIDAQRRLTEALLHCDFNLKITLMEDRLCPPVPNRLNYILWIQDIIRSCDLPERPVRGIDVGTGASAIYPLLACSMDPSWHMVGLEIDDESARCALQNVAANNLSDRIDIRMSVLDGPIFALFDDDLDTQYDFTMCNPPFYGSAQEIAESAEGKLYGPRSVCSGAAVEMVTPGGEVAFVSQMVRESVQHKTRCRWFTSMLGKLSSVSVVIELIKALGIDNYGITEFVQGQTRRWAVVWSFGRERLPDSITRIRNPSLQKHMPPHNCLYQPFSSEHTVTQLQDAVQRVLDAIEGVSWSCNMHKSEDSGEESPAPETSSRMIVKAAQNTWSRSARRKKKAEMEEQSDALASGLRQVVEPILRCSMKCMDNVEELELEYTWTEGEDRGVFESFASHVNRKVGDLLAGG
ncbi:hypothetical protein CONPUDRAFT_169696 [Coniophora puteana RWD-64-598 SS2]|uniref:S-adenosyl-L-methionine dependent methyltransferase n=1 Tax=Coniophora puteana (strain RWD-64-598) TaxID=741705 RepID=A0A5M3M6N9_CONPW|nr:uncharacterized protein CONPUDRAFT_169696 [Coniophora puteana RWD-64-598 SS2]EIW74733.1 hypothetical protein CONPUDRAFT_169696 [Coniophora puteana RWD-64-598 SS2]